MGRNVKCEQTADSRGDHNIERAARFACDHVKTFKLTPHISPLSFSSCIGTRFGTRSWWVRERPRGREGCRHAITAPARRPCSPCVVGEGEAQGEGNHGPRPPPLFPVPPSRRASSTALTLAEKSLTAEAGVIQCVMGERAGGSWVC